MSANQAPPSRLMAFALAAFLVPAAMAGLSRPSLFEATVDRREEATYRIRKHLARVEMDMRLHPPAGLTSAQMAARESRLDDLRAYRESGVFPVNPSLSDTLHPIFIDARGTACAVGHLIIASGARDLAEEIAAAQNHAYVPEIRHPRLPEWVAANGLTLEECARIQPAYGYEVFRYAHALALDGRQRLWMVGRTMGPDLGWGVGHMEAGRWRLDSDGSLSKMTGFCLSPSGGFLLADDQMVHGAWQGNMILDAPVFGCASLSEDEVLAGSPGGFRLFKLPAGAPPSRPEVRNVQGFLGDTVRWVVRMGSQYLAASERAMAVGDSTARSWTPISVPPLDGRISGLVADGRNGVWVGVEGQPSTTPSKFDAPPPFSTRGLRYRSPEGAWSVYRVTMSSVQIPDDFIQALCPMPGGAVVLATARGLFRFTPPLGLEKLDLPNTMSVLSMSADTAGTLYLGTAYGVYQWRPEGSLSLGYPARGPSGIRESNGPEKPMGGRLAEGEGGKAGNTRSVSGRQDAGRQAVGIRFPDRIPTAR